MSREIILENTLKTIMTEKEIHSYVSYELTSNDEIFLKEVIEEVLRKLPVKAFNCGLSSALLGAVILDNSSIPVSVICGHLDYFTKRIFTCYILIPYSTENISINEIWDGHCWVEINNLIIDISIFRTVYNGKVPNDLFDKIISQFGKGRGALLGSPKEIQKLGFNYIPCYGLTQDQISGLIRGINS